MTRLARVLIHDLKWLAVALAVVAGMVAIVAALIGVIANIGLLIEPDAVASPLAASLVPFGRYVIVATIIAVLAGWLYSLYRRSR